jgi:hypothetical protein
VKSPQEILEEIYTFTEYFVQRSEAMLRCNSCGALVLPYDAERHREWHESVNSIGRSR